MKKKKTVKFETFEQINRKEYIKNTYAFLLIIGALTFVTQFLFAQPPKWIFINLQPSVTEIICENLVTLLYGGIGIYTPYLIYNIIRHKSSGRFLTKDSLRVKPEFYALAIMGCAGLAAATYFVSDIITEHLELTFRIQETYSPAFYGSDSPAVYVSFILFAAVIPSFFNEITFRGIALSDAKPDNATFALIMSSMLYAFSVPSLRVAPIFAITGLFLGWIRIKCESVFVTYVANGVTYGLLAGAYCLKCTAPEAFSAIMPFAAGAGILVAIASAVILAVRNEGFGFTRCWNNLSNKEAAKALFLNIGFVASVGFFILRIIMKIVTIKP